MHEINEQSILGMRRRFQKTGHQPKTKVASLKNRIRSLTRLLQKSKNKGENGQDNDGLSAKRMELTALQLELSTKENSALEIEHVKRFKMIKFFERRKCLRKLQKATKEEKCTKEILIQLKYIYYFPKNQDYISLFKTKEKEGGRRDAFLQEMAKKDEEEVSSEAWKGFQVFCKPQKQKKEKEDDRCEMNEQQATTSTGDEQVLENNGSSEEESEEEEVDDFFQA